MEMTDKYVYFSVDGNTIRYRADKLSGTLDRWFKSFGWCCINLKISELDLNIHPEAKYPSRYIKLQNCQSGNK